MLSAFTVKAEQLTCKAQNIYYRLSTFIQNVWDQEGVVGHSSNPTQGAEMGWGGGD
jgi:hypothetical protein